MRNLLLILFIVTANLCSAQSFSYRFKGTFDEGLLQKISADLLANPEFSDVKFKLKESSGELLFRFTAKPTKSEESPISPAIIAKQIIIKNGLEPIELVQLP